MELVLWSVSPHTAVYSFKEGRSKALDKQTDYSRTSRRVVFIQATLREVQRGQVHPSNETFPALSCRLTLHLSHHPRTSSPAKNLHVMWPPGGLVSSSVTVERKPLYCTIKKSPRQLCPCTAAFQHKLAVWRKPGCDRKLPVRSYDGMQCTSDVWAREPVCHQWTPSIFAATTAIHRKKWNSSRPQIKRSHFTVGEQQGNGRGTWVKRKRSLSTTTHANRLLCLGLDPVSNFC